MRSFDYTFLQHGSLPARFFNTFGSICELRERERIQKDSFSEVFAKLEAIAKVASVKSSNEIEGIYTTDERYNAIVSENSPPLSIYEAEIAGYRDALSLVHEGYCVTGFTEPCIMKLYAAMLFYTEDGGGDALPMGPSNAVAEILAAYLEAKNSRSISHLLLVPCISLDFMLARPFHKGNERMSRLVMLLLLSLSGFDLGRYISVEERLQKTSDQYHESIRQSAKGWEEGTNSYLPFMEYFIETLLICYKDLDKRFAVVGPSKATKRQRVEATALNSVLPISKHEICYILSDVSPTTVEAVLTSMVKTGSLEKIGNARNTKYFRKFGF